MRLLLIENPQGNADQQQQCDIYGKSKKNDMETIRSYQLTEQRHSEIYRPYPINSYPLHYILL